MAVVAQMHIDNQHHASQTLMLMMVMLMTVVVTMIVVVSPICHPIPACMETSVTRAPALDWVLSVSRYAAIGVGRVLDPGDNEVNWFEEPVRIVNAVGSEEFGDG